MESQGPPPPPPPGDEEPPPPPPPERPRCPNCGAEHELDQEYCLECGQRLPLPGQPVRHTVLWSRDSPAWLWATLAALLLVALVAGAIAAVAATNDDEGAAKPVVSTNGQTTETIGTIQDTTPLTLNSPTGTTETILPTGPTTVSVPTLTTSSTPTTTAPTTQPTTTNSSGEIIDWPSGKDGFTIILESVPTSKGRGKAEKKANAAIDAGLPEVGILNSSDYLSLNPGYYVVFTGVYDSTSEAESHLATARSFQPAAYVREITP